MMTSAKTETDSRNRANKPLTIGFWNPIHRLPSLCYRRAAVGETIRHHLEACLIGQRVASRYKHGRATA